MRDPFSPAEPVRSRADQLPICLLLVLLLSLLIVFRQRADHPLGVRTDSWTEANIYVSARNVGLNGWAKYRGAAPHQVDRPPFVEDPFYRYAHYPLWTYYINWILYDLGARSLAAWRWPPMLLSLLSLLLWYLLLCRFVSRWVALLATAVLGTSYGFVDFADNVHHGYSNVLVAGMMLCFVAGVAARGRRRRLLMGGSWALLFINAFVSWEWYFWSQVFYWGYALLLGVPFKKRWLLVFAVAPVLSFGIQSYQRSLALGPQTGASFGDDLLRRTIHLEETADTPPDVTLANYPLLVAKRFQAYYGIGFVPVCALAVAWGVLFGGLRRSLRNLRPVLSLVVVLLACSVSWWCIMLQHTAVHPHVMRHAQLFCSLVLGLSIAAGVVYALRSDSALWWRAAGAIVAVLLLWTHGARSYQNFKLHSDPQYRHPNGWDAGWSESRDFADLGRRLPGDAILLTNNNRLPLLRFWTNQPVYVATFLRYPYDRRRVVPGSRVFVELAPNHLKELYGDHPPRMLYLYFFRSAPNVAYASDPILWQLVDGTWTERPTAAGTANFARVIRGQGSTKYPIVARGPNWMAFDAAQFFDNLPPVLRRLPPPTRAEFGPPR